MQRQHDIAGFPALFDGIEQYLDEQISALKRRLLLAGVLLLPTALGLAWLLPRP